MQRKILLTVAMMCAAVASTAALHGFVLQGTILRVDGKPLLRADARVFRFGDEKPIAAATAKNDGTFRLHIGAPGAFRVLLSGVGVAPVDAPLLVERSTHITVNAHLAAYEIFSTIDSVKIIGDFNSFSFSHAKPMTKLSDGTFAIDIATKADTFAYQILGVQRTGKSINGTVAEYFIPDEAGDYRSVMKTTNGIAHIVVDPQLIDRSAAGAVLQWKPRSVDHWMQTSAMIDSMRKEFQRVTAASPGNPQVMINAAVPSIHVLDSLITNEKQKHARQLLMMEYIEFGLPGVMTGKNISDTQMVSRALEEISPSADIWEIHPGLIVLAAAELGMSNEAKRYISEALDQLGSADAKAEVLYNAIQFCAFTNRKTESAEYYDRLIAEYPETHWSRSAKNQYAPARNIVAGKSAPRFSVASLEDTTVLLSSASFHGKFLLIDFWAVWCGPCVGEMENLHNAYKNFHEKNFEILSISFDQAPRDVAAFRKKKWPMPWTQAFAAGAFASGIAELFEVHSIPKPVLIDPDGNILATDIELRGINLEATLKKYLSR